MKALNFVKKDGKILCPEDLSKGLSLILSAIKNGEYSISIEPVKRQRTLSQNRLLWLWLKFLSDQTGNSTEELKQFFQAKFLRDEVEVSGRSVVVVRGTSTLKKEEMIKFLDSISSWCVQELGIALPDPDGLKLLGYE